MTAANANSTAMPDRSTRFEKAPVARTQNRSVRAAEAVPIWHARALEDAPRVVAGDARSLAAPAGAG